MENGHETTTNGQKASEIWQQNLSAQETEHWMSVLQVNRPINTEDKEKSKEALSALEFYKTREKSAFQLGEMIQKCTNKEDCDEIFKLLEGMDYPHQEDALSEIKDAVSKLKSTLPSSAPADTPEEDSEINVHTGTGGNEVVPGGSELVRQLTNALLPKDAALAAKVAALETKDAALAASRLYSMAVNVRSATADADSMLGQMALLSQAENSIMPNTEDARIQSQREKEYQMKANIQYRDDKNVLPESPPNPLSELYKNAPLFDDDSPFSNVQLAALWNNKLEDKIKKTIQAIDKTYNDFIKESIILGSRTSTGGKDANKQESKRKAQDQWPRSDPSKRLEKSRDDTTGTTLPVYNDTKETRTLMTTAETYKKHVKSSVRALNELFGKHLQNGIYSVSAHEKAPTPKVPPRKASARSCQEEQDVKGESYFPGPRANEVVGSQPIFACLLKAIGSVAEECYLNQASLNKFSAQQESKTTSTTTKSPTEDGSVQIKNTPEAKSPAKNQLVKESAVLGEGGKYRYGDFVIQKRGKYLWVFRADTLPIVFEVKAFYRADKSWEELIINAVQQVFNHTSRYLRVNLNFAGAGVDSHATGVIGSLAYLQIYRLELKKVGTPDVSVVCVRSALLPLMSKENFLRWVQSNHPDEKGEQSKIKSSENILYSAPEDNVPYGLLAMLQLMTSSKSELFGQTRDSGDGLSLLASGAFGNVYLKNDGTVVKLSRHGRASYLRAEGLAYKAVGHYGPQETGSGRCQNLAVAENVEETIKVGNRSIKLDALSVKPAGRPLLRMGNLANKGNLLCDVVFGIARALQHMHKFGVAHNDVSIANVIVLKLPTGGYQSKLVDLSLASPFIQEIPIFIGSPTYAHRDVHKDTKWHPRPFHDMAALGFLAAVLAAGSVVPWEGFSSPTDSEDELEARHEKALDSLGKLKGNKCVPQFKQWINLDKEATVLRNPCNCRKLCSASNGCACAKSGLQCLDKKCKCGSECSQRSQEFPVVSAVSMDEIKYERMLGQHNAEG